jgi:hypothetical protein
MDILYVGIGFLFFTVSWGMIRFFEDLGGGDR